MNWRERVQEWLAERFECVQYPRIRRVREPRHDRLALSPLERFNAALMLCFWIVFLSGALVAMLIVGWAFLSAAAGF